MPNVILDTNVILSGVLFGGTPALLLNGIVNKQFTLCASQKLYDEVFNKLVNKFRVGIDILSDVDRILGAANIYTPSHLVIFPTDPKDAYLLALAEECGADYLVTGDKKHLLPLKKWKTTQIITAKQAEEILI